MKLLSTNPDQRALSTIIYTICSILPEIKFGEKEVLKHRLIENLIKEIRVDNNKMIIFGSLKILKCLWRGG